MKSFSCKPHTGMRRSLELFRLERSGEETYINADGEAVAWLFAEVVTLYEMRGGQLDGAEVFSSVMRVPPGSKKASEHVFSHEKSMPASTGI
jgi:hypothetical protein